MAKVEGILEFNGKIGDLVFYKIGKTRVVRRIDKDRGERIKNDPKFEKVKANGQLFGKVSQLNKKIRLVMGEAINGVADTSFVNRVNKVFMNMVKRREYKYGDRELDLKEYGYLLNGFELNIRRKNGKELFAGIQKDETENVIRIGVTDTLDYVQATAVVVGIGNLDKGIEEWDVGEVVQSGFEKEICFEKRENVFYIIAIIFKGELNNGFLMIR